jgi:hypothetical protein
MNVHLLGIDYSYWLYDHLGYAFRKVIGNWVQETQHPADYSTYTIVDSRRTEDYLFDVMKG